jgi:non-ribosomal peptide synthetase component F
MGGAIMHPGVFAAKEPERPAVIMGAAGPVLTYAELEARSNQVAWLARCGPAGCVLPFTSSWL